MVSSTIKLASLAALLIVVATTMAEASIYRTTVTTYETVDSNDRQSERCREEVMRQRLDSCGEFMTRRRPAALLLMRAEVDQEVPQQCCQQLGQVSEECRCEAIRCMMQDVMQEGFGREERKEEMVRMAERLPFMCGMRPQHCTIRGQVY